MHKGNLELIKLEMQLEEKASKDHESGKNKIRNCDKCHIKPVHSYDSFGMPMHYLKCPECGQNVQAAKDYMQAVRLWNVLMGGPKADCHKCKHYSEDYDKCANTRLLHEHGCTDEQIKNDPWDYLLIWQIVNQNYSCDSFAPGESKKLPWVDPK